LADQSAVVPHLNDIDTRKEESMYTSANLPFWIRKGVEGVKGAGIICKT
jgi:hypothetical protein